ncbi:cyclophane-forming radical SAM/SPASM peptide maturase GrrM/OscB [Roseovarius sp. EL26]|uniref:cyclophane-forming radical SAM/SPASM peptide maturase GrrM/OscB n=1 Tax=Roseovarius sp. EL26 TaxID=2126672 RepID=UPI000EA21E75|nr:cyclophane-forming radical SAM/SPASM peptide maturase GrrM/OscB [Roseovarius sp. EL26]
MYIGGLARTQLLVLQPTTFCNLDCSYCYLPDRANNARMGDDVLQAIGAHIVASAAFQDDTTLIWHAGEPLVLSPDWYRNAVKILQTASGRGIPRQSFQTNATLITDAWIEYLKDPTVSVGVSLDGPEDLNDLFRTDRRGRGTWHSTMGGIEKLRLADVPFHIIAVITEAALDRPREIAGALVDAGPAYIGLNIEEIDGINARSTLFEASAQDRIKAFISEFVNTLETYEDPPRLREAMVLTSLLDGARRGLPARNQENVPGAILSVDTKGNISTYSPELLGIESEDYSDFLFGNVKEISDIADIFFSRTFLKCQSAVAAGVARCKKTCGHFALCGGGAPANKFGETGRLDCTETQFCKIAVKTVLDTLMTHQKQRSFHLKDHSHG